jgi:hypothetical protein
MMIEIILGVIGTGLLGVFGWAFTLNGRVAVLEADKVSLRELLDSKLQNITDRLQRIESKIDHQA